MKSRDKEPVSAKRSLHEMYKRLSAAYGPQHWWPGKTATEVVVGAILAQNTAWKNVERAIANLKRAGCLSFRALRPLPVEELGELIRPSGTYRIKAARLKTFVDVLWKHHGGSWKAMFDGELESARRRLLGIPGIGPETADAMLLYAGGRPTFVVDAYTMRVLRRHHLVGRQTDYETVRQLFHRALTPDVPVYNEFHALFVAVGKRHCRTRARCDACPLADMPHDAEL